MRFLYTSILLTISIHILAQFSVKTELEYLKIIHKQGVVDLIDGNLRNAELVADSLIIKGINTETNAFFMKELALSYFLTKEYELALFTILEQRTIFPNSKVEHQSKTLFMETVFRNNLSDSTAQSLWELSLYRKNKKDINLNIINCLKLTSQLQKKQIESNIYRLGLELRNKTNSIPLWYKHWEFLTLINMKETRKNEILTYAKTEAPIYQQIQNKKLQYKTYRRTIKHYIKANSFVQARNILSEYKNKDLSIFLKLDAQIKRFRIRIRV